METRVFFSGALSGIAEWWLESYVLYLAWPEWKGLKFYSPLWFHPFGWKHRGIAGGSQGEYHKITGNVWVEPWVGLQGANKSAHWDGWEIGNPLELYCRRVQSHTPASRLRTGLVIRIASLRRFWVPTTYVLWRNKENYPLIITKYPP